VTPRWANRSSSAPQIFGAARWLSTEKALIQLSLYYKREDQLWFSFFHEAAHILFHGRRDIFVDFDAGATDKQEDEANRFASDHLIHAPAYARVIARSNFSEMAVLSLRSTLVLRKESLLVGFNSTTEPFNSTIWCICAGELGGRQEATSSVSPDPDDGSEPQSTVVR
jgi:hypothetical protein